MSPLRFPGLDQCVLLDRGEAWQLAKAVARVVLDVRQAPAPQPAVHVLTCLPLAGLTRKLYQLHQREQAAPLQPGRPPKPRQLLVSYDQLAALLHHREAICCWVGSPLEKLQLQGIVGKFQQKSLNLSQFLTF